jgi:topoisomerase IA-like protein
MPRFRNVLSDVVVSVDDERAESLDAEWEPVEEAEAPAKKAPAKKTAAKKSSSK